MRQISKWNKQIRAIPSRFELEALHPWPEMNRSSCKGTFPACVRPGLHLVEWTRHNVGLSYFAGAHTVHSSGWGLLAPLSSISGKFHCYMNSTQCSEFSNPLSGYFLLFFKDFTLAKFKFLQEAMPVTKGILCF